MLEEKSQTNTVCEMDKIGIITIFNVNNYGAELQAFSLQKKLEMLGHKSEIINYLYYKNWKFKDTEMSSSLLSMHGKQRILFWFKYRFAAFVIEEIFPIFNRAVKNRRSNFIRFHRDNTKFSRGFRSMPSLYKHKFDYNMYIAGSDQIWNPAALSSIEPYFLTFAPKGARKISYASSFGVADVDKSLYGVFAGFLNNIDCISVREVTGVDLVKRLSGKNAQWVVDPTLLLTKEEWKGYMNDYPGMPARYVLIYQLASSKAITDMALRIGKERNIPVYRICKRAFRVEKNIGIINILDAGPAEFLSLIDNAEFVITNSFHGTAFSVNLNVSFFVIISAKKKNNSRMESLLSMVDLNERLLKDDIDVMTIDINRKIEFTKAMHELREKRMISEDFLKKNL